YTSSIAAAIYVCENNTLHLTASLGLDDSTKKTFSMGEGLVGKCANEQKMITLYNLPQNDIIVSHATGNIKPGNLVILPVIWENDLKAVVELASIEPYSNATIEFFETVSSNIGLSIESAKQNARLQLLLSETQAQAEELQMQQHELEYLNADLETQAQKLQVSEEELKVQQEELLQANQELEERSSMLEEKNQMIVERNLEIQKKADELETTTKYKSEFLANMSHELRTPLNSILLLSRLLSENNEKTLTGEQEEFARVIQNSGNGLLTLIDEILDLSKIEAGKMKVEFRDVNVAEISNNLNSLFAPLAKEKGLSFSIHTDENVPQSIVTDSVRLEQILKNLLSNAIKFTAKGSVEMQVKKNEQNKIQFSVTDTGIGIAEDKQHLVFEAFQQADGSTRRKYGGTGLGLSISRELTKLLSGEITLQSELKKGSTFTLVIPADAKVQPATEEINIPPSLAQLKPFQQVMAEEKISIPGDSQPVFDDRDNIKQGDKVILIVEDDTTFAQTLLSVAHKNNYKGLIALRGDHGVQLASQYLPTAILLDIRLPVKDGWQVMDELKTNAATRHIPVHMMSSMQAKEESLNRGAIDFIDKPMALDKLPEVFNRIEQALQQGPKKILIVEENEKHAQALCYFLESYNINVKGTQDITEAVNILKDGSADCVVLEMKVFADNGHDALENIKNTDGLEQLPIIIFTGKSLSKGEESRIKQVADSIVVKTANSYKRILDEIDVFLQIVEENDPNKPKRTTRRLSALESVLQNKTVLIADDDVRNIYSLTKALEAHKMTVISATDGKDALEQ
ncbi:MAG: ATP-binding protein, partial [Bacteroidota bacterium]|nr:ATP-binding protein [Bacteroidota bacterium]